MKLSKRLSLALATVTLSLTSATTMACSTDGYIGVINVFAGNFAIRNCAFANGALLSIASNQALFSILGTTYGGDGRSTFALPDTRGRAVIGAGTGPGLSPVSLGQKAGVQTISAVLSHSHTATTTVVASATANANTAGNTDSPSGNVWGAISRENLYSSSAPNATMAADAVTLSASATTAVGTSGSGSSHDNRGPYIGMNWLIQTLGIFPPRN